MALQLYVIWSYIWLPSCLRGFQGTFTSSTASGSNDAMGAQEPLRSTCGRCKTYLEKINP